MPKKKITFNGQVEILQNFAIKTKKKLYLLNEFPRKSNNLNIILQTI